MFTLTKFNSLSFCFLKTAQELSVRVREERDEAKTQMQENGF